LGLDPGPELRALERAILNQDPAFRPVQTLPPAAAGTTVEERKLVTVLHAESTSASADPEHALYLADAFSAVATATIEGTGGTVVSIATGSITAVFGSPSTPEDDSSRALRTALALVTRPDFQARVGGVALDLDLRELLGDWLGARTRTEVALQRIEDNAATPCANGPRALLICAQGHAAAGDAQGAAELEHEAGNLGMEAHEIEFGTQRLRLALLRGDLVELRRLTSTPLMDKWNPFWLACVVANHLDALTALDDRERIEAEAPAFAQKGAVFEPFALRALGVARRDRRLIDAALVGFETIGLEWHAAQTEALAGHV
jgi:class 3 adenylate cyclase